MAEVVTIVDYDAGNLASVRLAVEKLGVQACVTRDPQVVRSAGRVIFPGVGAASAAMASLERMGLTDALRDYAATGRPLLGICLGAQIILEHSEEGDVACVGLLAGRARRFDLPVGVKVPHMGWNGVEFVRTHPLWAGLTTGCACYFVHGYYPSPADPSTAIGRTDYHGPFTCAVARDNIVATQFHPERSGRVGLTMLGNFLSWNP